MPSVPAVLTRSIRLAAAVSPTLAGDIAYRLFFTMTPRMPVGEADAPTHADARRGRLTVRGREVVTYEWGTGSRTALLLHGWRGRAAQFAPLVRELRAEGFRVIAFDAPAHGSSSGRSTDIRDWIDAAEQLHAGHGPFAMIVGHSFGALAALTVARSTVPAPAVAAIAGAAAPDAFLAQFAADLRLDAATTARLSEQFHARLGMDESTVSARFDAVQHPPPPTTRPCSWCTTAATGGCPTTTPSACTTPTARARVWCGPRASDTRGCCRRMRPSTLSSRWPRAGR